MILYFWLSVCLLLLLALLMIIFPLWRKVAVNCAETEQRNIDIARQRLSELRQQQQTGELTQEQFDEQSQELELTLADDLSFEKKPIQPGNQGRWVILPLIILVPVFSLLGYFSLGDLHALKQAEIQASQPSADDVRVMVAQLAERMKKDPDNAKGWFMLGRSQLHLENYQQAADAFEHAYQLMGKQPDIMINYANALILANSGTISELAAQLISMTLSQQPNNSTALWLAGLLQIQHNRLPQALSYWQKLLAQLPVDSPSFGDLQAKIAAIEEKFSPSPVMKNITVTVKLSPLLTEKLPPQASLFIYAQALKGSAMPLAVIKKTVDTLPLTVVLDDTLAMMPAMKLSRFDQVKVIARISRSGSATKQAGDLFGMVELTDFSKKIAVTLIIDRVWSI